MKERLAAWTRRRAQPLVVSAIVVVGCFLQAPGRLVRIGFMFMGGAAAANVLVCLFAPPRVALNIAPIFFFMIGSAMATPSIMVMLLDLFPAMRGLASSLQGFVQFVLGGLVAGTVAPLLDRSLVALALGMAAFSAVSWVLWVHQQRRAHVVPSS